LVSVNVLTPGQVGLVLAWVTFLTGSIHVHSILLFNQLSKSTESGHLSMCRGAMSTSDTWVVIRHQGRI